MSAAAPLLSGEYARMSQLVSYCHGVLVALDDAVLGLESSRFSGRYTFNAAERAYLTHLVRTDDMADALNAVDSIESAEDYCDRAAIVATGVVTIIDALERACARQWSPDADYWTDSEGEPHRFPIFSRSQQQTIRGWFPVNATSIALELSELTTVIA